MKYVYVLTSSNKDFYYEQFLISVFSLRLRSPESHITVLVDAKTKEGLTDKRSEYEKYVSETVVIATPPELSQKEVSRWIKTSIKSRVSGDFLFIDCDTVIAEPLVCDFPAEINIGAVLDTHVELSKHHLAPYFKTRGKKLGFTSFFNFGLYFNSGVIFCRDAPETERFFSLWHSLWLSGREKGVYQDQGALNQANSELNGAITELDGTWNCQITHNGLPYLSDAKIIHSFASSLKLFNCPFLPASTSALSYVKETGKISDELTRFLKNPKAAFEAESRIICGETELDVINSKLFSLLMFIRKKTPGLFKAVNSFMLKTRGMTQK